MMILSWRGRMWRICNNMLQTKTIIGWWVVEREQEWLIMPCEILYKGPTIKSTTQCAATTK